MTLRSADEYRDAIRTEADRLVRAAEDASLDATIPSCPDWDVAELLGHMGRVYRWCAACVDANELVSPRDLPGPPERDARVVWVQEGVTRVLDALDRPASDPAWTWAPNGTVGFWQRRQAHETAVHRVDAELATGAPTPIPRALAVDGIDECLELLPNRFGVAPIAGTGETLHLHCTDGDGEWLLRVTADGLDVERVHAKGDVAVRGPASDLFLVLLRRRSPDDVEVLGDRAVLDRFLTQASF
jgi:uncharacterized protein (TIGR03083 family)